MNELFAQNVSRETYDKLRAYEALIQKWNPSINLVAKSTLSSVWNRHIMDSAQVYFAAVDDRSSTWTDIGSGGGLPGIVVATLAQGDGQQINVTMVESDKRKSVFLRTAIRELNLSSAKVINERIESAQNPSVWYRFGKGAGAVNRPFRIFSAVFGSQYNIPVSEGKKLGFRN